MEPFFPPQSPYQSVNLRAAFFRTFSQLKKAGMILNDVAIRKSTFDECKGEKFNELLAIFSTVVMFKQLKDWDLIKDTLALKLATTPVLRVREQKSLLPLAVAHRASLTNIIKKKETLRTTYRQFQSAMDAKEEEDRIKARDLPTKYDARTAKHARAVAELTKQCDTYWQGEPKWKEIVLKGNIIEIPDSLLEEPFPKRGSQITGITTGEVSASHQPGLSENLDKRLKAQQAMVEQWKSFREAHTATTVADRSAPGSSRKSQPTRRMGLSLDGHQNLQINTDEPKRTVLDGPSLGRGSVSEIVDEYEKLTKTLLEKFDNIDRPRELSFSRQQGLLNNHGVWDQGETHNTGLLPENDSGDTLGNTSEGNIKAAALLPPLRQARLPIHSNGGSQGSNDWSVIKGSSGSGILSQPGHVENTTLPEKKLNYTGKAEVFSAGKHELRTEQVTQLSLNALPSPETRQPSLLERTRKSMALAQAEEYVGSNVSSPDNVPHLPVSVRDSQLHGSNPKLNGRETLVERTRQSMSLLPLKSRAAHTSMLKQPSKVYPTNPFETIKKSRAEMNEFSTSPEELLSQDANYASVFKSRPKIALSPTHSPYIGGIDVTGLGNGSSQYDMGERMGSSPLQRATRGTGRG
jgi:hypothetical protein